MIFQQCVSKIADIWRQCSLPWKGQVIPHWPRTPIITTSFLLVNLKYHQPSGSADNVQSIHFIDRMYRVISTISPSTKVLCFFGQRWLPCSMKHHCSSWLIKNNSNNYMISNITVIEYARCSFCYLTPSIT